MNKDIFDILISKMTQYEKIKNNKGDTEQQYLSVYSQSQRQCEQNKFTFQLLEPQQQICNQSELPKNILKIIFLGLVIGIFLLLKSRVDIAASDKRVKVKQNIIIKKESQQSSIKTLIQTPQQILIVQQNKNKEFDNIKKLNQNKQKTEEIMGLQNFQNKQYPQIGVFHNQVSIKFQQQQLGSHQMHLQTLEIAKQYIKLGLNQPTNDLIEMQTKYYESKYKLDQVYKNQLKSVEIPFCIIIPSFNNQKNKRYMLPLVSIFRQNYSNYHVVYIDDASTDNTANLVQEYVSERNIAKQKFKLIRNKQHKGPLRNQYQAGLSQCAKTQVSFIIDGDDGISGTQVFKLFNHFYQTTNSWFVYSNYIQVGNYAIGVSRKIRNMILRQRNYRSLALSVWITSHQTSFFSVMFHKMNKQNLMQYNQQKKQKVFFTVNADRALDYQVVQLSGTRIYYINQITYLYLQSTQFSQATVNLNQQKRVLKVISKLPKQNELKSLFDENEQSQNTK